MLFAFKERALVQRLSVVPTLLAFAMLQVVQPVPYVSSSSCVNKRPIAIGLVLLPITLVDIPVGVSHASVAITLAVLPHAFEFGAVWP